LRKHSDSQASSNKELSKNPVHLVGGVFSLI